MLCGLRWSGPGSRSMGAKQLYQSIIGIDKVRLAVAWRSVEIAGTTSCDASWRGNANVSFVRRRQSMRVAGTGAEALG